MGYSVNKIVKKLSLKQDKTFLYPMSVKRLHWLTPEKHKVYRIIEKKKTKKPKTKNYLRYFSYRDY